MYVNLNDDAILRETFEAYITTPHWDELTTKIFKAVVREGDVVLDLGANLGYYSLLASRLVGTKGKVYSFEPEPRNYRLLCRNLELNGIRNVTALQKAVSDKTEKVKLHISNKDSGAHTIRDTEDSGEYEDFIEIEAVKLDEYFLDKSRRVNVIKMDVEGYEPKAFIGLTKIVTSRCSLSISRS
jgi:FkbM family methyltransferase